MNCPHPTSFSVCIYLCVVGECIPHPSKLISFGWGKFTGAITIQLVSAGTLCGLSDRQNRYSSPEELNEAACFRSGEGIWWRNLLLFGLYLQQMPSPEKMHDGKMTTSPAIFSYIGHFLVKRISIHHPSSLAFAMLAVATPLPLSLQHLHLGHQLQTFLELDSLNAFEQGFVTHLMLHD